jgi:hypothetical protein
MAAEPVDDPSKDSSYKSVNSRDIAAVEIFPPVGIARVGDSEKEYFFAPEVPGNISPPTPDKKFRDDQQKIRRQVASSINLNPVIVFTINLLGRPLPRICVRQEWLAARGSQ